MERLNESGELREMLKPYQVIRNQDESPFFHSTPVTETESSVFHDYD